MEIFWSAILEKPELRKKKKNSNTRYEALKIKNVEKIGHRSDTQIT